MNHSRAGQKGRSVPPSMPVLMPDATDRLFSTLQRDILPAQIEQILAGALAGDLNQQGALFELMIETWPRLAKNLGEVRTAVGKAPWSVMPYADKGKDPTPRDQEIADYVERAIWGMRPDPAAFELGFEDLVGWIAESRTVGHQIAEVLWHSTPDGILPRAARTVSSQFYGYPWAKGQPDRLMLRPSGYANGALEPFPEHHFLVSIRRAHTGHPTVSAPMRGLVGFWVAARWGLRWLLQFSQLFGIPFRWATYRDETVLDEVSDMLANIGTSGWGAFPEGTEISLTETSRTAGSLPQEALMDRADRMADVVILGQTLTSDVADSGSRALGSVHAGIRREVLCGAADIAAAAINGQLIPSIVALNYGETVRLPWLAPSIPEPRDEKAQAERDKILFSDMGLPVAKAWLYERHDVPPPGPDDDLFEPSAPSPPPGAGSESPPPAGQENGEEDEDGQPPDAMDEDEDQDAQAAQASLARRAATVDRISDMVLGGISDVAPKWLRGVRPHFAKLVSAALSGDVSDADFLRTIERAQAQLPELFADLDREALQKALEEAISAGLLTGATERL